MASLKKNIVVNIIARFWSAGILILLVPFYIKYLGIEAYGLVGFYATLIGALLILDFGLSITLNRELAKYKSENKPIVDIRNLTFSLECVYWAVGTALSLIVIAFSGVIAEYWVNAEELSVHEVQQAVMLMGIIILFQWPISLYSGGLSGLEKQVLNNIIIIVMSTIRASGVLLVLAYFSSTVYAFFLWQAVTTFIYVLLMKWALWKEMPGRHLSKRFSKQQIKLIWRFAAGMTAVSLVTFLLSQIDKIILSKMLSLSQFGYYSLALSIASCITLLTAPVIISFFPRYSYSFAAKNFDDLKNLYHKSSKLIAVLIFPLSFFLLFFMQDVLLIWTKNAEITKNTYLLAQILVIGNMLNALMNVPYNLLIASGYTRFAFIQNFIAALLMVPLLILLTNLYGANGAAFVWVLINAGYILISMPLIHLKLLKKELKNWYLNDTLKPMLVPLFLFAMIKYFFQHFLPDAPLSLIILSLVFFTVFLTSLLTNLPEASIAMKNAFSNFKKQHAQ
ncbi:MAG: oligosaccharide flippase family protein [Bacteroidota bacterium]|nr:oligosaccharide flippase family protein [Bacteroidota bacterium]